MIGVDSIDVVICDVVDVWASLANTKTQTAAK
jgi:hypothetical protein